MNSGGSDLHNSDWPLRSHTQSTGNFDNATILISMGFNFFYLVNLAQNVFFFLHGAYVVLI